MTRGLVPRLTIFMLAWSLMGTSCVRFLIVEDRYSAKTCPISEKLAAEFTLDGFRANPLASAKSCARGRSFQVFATSSSGAVAGDFPLQLEWQAVKDGACEIRFRAQIPCRQNLTVEQCLQKSWSGEKPTDSESLDTGLRKLAQVEARFLKQNGVELLGKGSVHSITEAKEPMRAQCE